MKILKFALPMVIFLAFAAVFYFGYPNINDADSLYHIRHAWVYRTSGLLNSDFPWTQYSVIKSLGADLWYGFHLLLIPFTFFKDLLLGIKISGIFLTAGSLLIYFLILKKLTIRWPLFWSLIMALAAPDMLFRVTMMRPHILTFALAMLFFYFLISSHRHRYAAVFLTAFGVSFMHLALAWLAILIFSAVTIVKIISRRSLDLISNFYFLISIFFGLILGWLLRPNPFGAIKLAYIQVIQLMIEKFKEAPLRFGAELQPADWSIVTNQFVPVLLLFIPAVIFFWRLPRERKTAAMWGSLILSLIFFFLTAFAARRSVDFWLGYTFIFIGLIVTAVSKERISAALRILGVLGGLAVMATMVFNSFVISSIYRRQAIPPDKFKMVSWWLEKYSQPGDIIINLHWDNFGALFFWNQKNYYVGGMDPMFQYAYDQSLYWKINFPETDRFVFEEGVIYTCGSIRCTAEDVVDLRTALKNDFRARYVLMEPRRNPRLKDALDKARGFENVYQTDTETVYKIH
jgi:hypothetical protein